MNLTPYWTSDDGRHVIYHCDSTELLTQLTDAGVDSIITDPPYGVSFQGKTTKDRTRREDTYQDEGFTFAMAAMVAFPCRSKLVFSGNRLLHDYPKPASIGCVYSSAGAGQEPWGFCVFHPILYYGACPYMATGQGSRPTGFASHATIREDIDHPCPKPLEWMTWAVKKASLPGELVLDPFSGSGTTSVACVQTHRRSIGIELDKNYCDVAVARIQAELDRERLFVDDQEMKPFQEAIW